MMTAQATETPGVDSGEGDVRASGIVERPKWSVGTNLLEWAGVVPGPKFTTWALNFNAEYYFKNRYSAKVIFAWSDHDYGKGKSKHQGFTSYMIQPRYWFKGDGGFRGFYAGPYVHFGDFNDIKGDTKLGEWDNPVVSNTGRKYTGKFWGAGLTGGYMWPVWRGLSLEFNIAAGYQHAGVKKYVRNSEGKRCLCDKFDKNRIFLSQLALNIQWRFK